MSRDPSRTPPDRNLALELVRVTEAAAMGASRWIGRGDKNAADQAAVDLMRFMVNSVSMRGVVVIGVAQEKMRAFKAHKLSGRGKAVSFDFSRQSVAVNHYYFYVQDPDWGPAFLKFGTYLPYPIKLCLNGHEWVKQQLRRAGVMFGSLDNGFLTCADPTRRQTICDQLGPADVQAFFDRWTARLSVEANVRAYHVLSRLDPDHLADYQEHLEEWQARKIREEHLTKLPALKNREQYFLLFREYVHSMGDWGLLIDAPAGEFAERRAFDEASRTQALGAVRAGRRIPHPIVQNAGVLMLSVDFLCVGEYLFTPPLDSAPSFHDLRDEWDRAAQRELPVLLDMIGTLPKLPPSIADVFRRHSRRLLEYTPAA